MTNTIKKNRYNIHDFMTKKRMSSYTNIYDQSYKPNIVESIKVLTSVLAISCLSYGNPLNSKQS